MSPVTSAVEGNSIMEVAKLSEIDESVTELVGRSVTARKTSYSPYSKFPVGAALQCTDGTIYVGCNVENASFGLTVCAERTAVVKAVSEGRKDFESIAVSATMEEQLTSPCGMCRQVLAEFNPRIKIYLHNPATNKIGITTLEHLLPYSFNPENTASLIIKTTPELTSSS